MKSGKVPCLGGFPQECLKWGGMAVLERLPRLLDECFDMGAVPKWTGVVYGYCPCTRAGMVTSINVVSREVLVY